MMLSALRRAAKPCALSLHGLDNFSCLSACVLRHVVAGVHHNPWGQQSEAAYGTWWFTHTTQPCPAFARSMCTRRHLTDARHRYNDMEKRSTEYTGSSRHTQKPGRQLVLAVDKSKESRYAVDWTLAHMYREGDKVQLVHCMNTQPRKFQFTIDAFQYATVGAPSVDEPDSTPALLRQQIDQLYGSRLADAMVPYDIEILGEERDDAPFTEGVGDQVSAFADSIKATALVVASHRASDLSEFLLGSLSTFLVRYANQPVLVLHPPRGEAANNVNNVSAAGPRDFVVAVDGSVMWALVVEWALNHIVRARDRVHIVQVLPKPRDVAQDFSFQASRTRVAEMFERAGASHSFELMLHGADQVGSSVAAAVCSRCDELKATALVTASNRTGLLSGSVMDTVTSHCAQHCSSTVVALH